MARLVDESFEGTGYEETWTETVETGCTVDEDSSGPGSLPTGGGNQCIQIIKGSGNEVAAYASRDLGSNPTSSLWFRTYIYVDTKSIASTNAVYVCFGGDSVPRTVGASWSIALYNNDGTYYFRLGYHQSTGWTYINGSTMSDDTWYRLEWELGGSAVEFRIDGVTQGSRATGVTLDRVSRYLFIGNIYGSTNTITQYQDLVAVDDANWIGEESAPPTESILLQMMMHHGG